MNGSVVRSRFLGYVRRGYKTLPDYKIVYVKPEKTRMWHPLKTGDRGLDIKVKEDDIMLKYRDSKLLQETDNEIVKRYFSLQFQRKKEEMALRQKLAQDLVKRHQFDSMSVESMIARLTAKIQFMLPFAEKEKHHVHMRRHLKETVDRRRLYLDYLRVWDYRKFEWILEKLNLEYRPYISGHPHVTRKNTLRMMTQDTCDKIINKKLAEYKQELEAKQEEFYTRKAKALEFIMNEEKEIGLKPTVTQEQIDQAKEKVEKAKMLRQERERANRTLNI